MSFAVFLREFNTGSLGRTSNAPGKLESAIHRVCEMLAERSEQKWPIVFGPKVAFALNCVVDPPLAHVENVGWLKVLFVEPVLIPSSPWRLCHSLLALDP
jgi:hypothetical protein